VVTGDDDIDALRARVAALRAEVYSRAGMASPLTDAVDPVTGESMRMRVNELELRQAEADVAALVSATTAPGAAAPTAIGTPPAAEESDLEEPYPGQVGGAETSGRRVSSILAVAVVTVIVVGVGAFAFGRVTGGPTILGASVPAPGGSVVALEPTRASAESAALQIFHTTQQPSDIPLILPDEDIDPSTTRSFVRPDTYVVEPDPEASNGAADGTADDGTGTATDSDIQPARAYAARTTTGLICLMAVFSDKSSAVTCSTEQRFADEGLRLRMTTPQIVPKADASGVDENAFYEYYWSSEGSFSSSSNAYRFPGSPQL
jgi:hypothetical protein